MTTPISIVSPDDQSVTFVELFFDLVFVFCITQVVGLLHEEVRLQSAGSALLVFWLVWWAWTQFTWALNAANTDHPRVQAIALFATAVAFFMGVGIPGSIHGGALWFAIPYLAVRAVGLLIYIWVAWADRAQRRAVTIFGLVSLTGLAAVLAGALVGGTALYWWWTLAIALDLIAAVIGASQEGWNLHPEHFVERHGLIVIIALGEALIVAAAGLAGSPRSAAVIATGVLAVAVTCGLWWSYFRRARATFEHELGARERDARSSTARDVFSVIHFPILCGVIAIAVATEAALAHPDQALAMNLRLALGGGAMLFVCGTAAALWRATGRTSPSRWVLAPVAAIAALTLGAVPWVALALIAAMLLAVAIVEEIAPASARAYAEIGD